MSAIEFAAAPARHTDGAPTVIPPEPPLLLWVPERRSQPMLEGASTACPGFRVLEADDVSSGVTILRESCPDVVVLDVGSGGRGAQLVADWPEEPSVPVIVVAAAGDADPVSALELGADDFMVKPVTSAELVARAHAAIRRSRAARPAPVPRQQPTLTLDRDLREVQADGRRVRLSPVDFRMLEYLARSPGRTFSLDHLLEAVWGSGVGWTIDTVRQHIDELRRTLDAGGLGHLSISTVAASGYRFDG